MNKGAWQATVHGVAKSRTRLKWLSMHAGMHLPLKNISSGKLWCSPFAVTVGDGWAQGPLLEGPRGLCVSFPLLPLLSPGKGEVKRRKKNFRGGLAEGDSRGKTNWGVQVVCSGVWNVNLFTHLTYENIRSALLIYLCVCVYLNSLRPLREVMNPTSRLSQKQQNKTKSVCVDKLQSKRIRRKLP